ncbi:MAG TPA: ATP-binding SpoIIE family protein phosphatase [Myxococcota bacterium]|nr:ATP-binding SpoIIE family protein phosphatase [Myxococcota bacterium]
MHLPPCHESWVIEVHDESAVGQARRAARALAEAIDLGTDDAGRVAIMVTELATNVHRHGRGGELLLRPLVVGGKAGVEILALDRGPGMANVAQCLQDGYSTGGTRGAGLGAVMRQASQFDVYSRPEQGTAIVARRLVAPAPPSALGVVCRAMPGEDVSGDAWSVNLDSDAGTFLVVDGLGHGPLAAAAARAATATFSECADRDPVGVVQAVHEALRPTRGAAVGVLRVRWAEGGAQYVGVGNIAAHLLHDRDSRSLVSQNGTAGMQAPRIQAFDYAWLPGGLIVLHSDGLRSRWSLDPYPGLAMRDPALIAGVLYRDFFRSTDDATVLVACEPPRQCRPTSATLNAAAP